MDEAVGQGAHRLRPTLPDMMCAPTTVGSQELETGPAGADSEVPKSTASIALLAQARVRRDEAAVDDRLKLRAFAGIDRKTNLRERLRHPTILPVSLCATVRSASSSSTASTRYSPMGCGGFSPLGELLTVSFNAPCPSGEPPSGYRQAQHAAVGNLRQGLDSR